ncbi:MAG: thiamine phosphate synthase [Nitrospira sp.]|nr:thiamine phosphate synthase [Candidatus Manganitrophaceae bacterium]HIL35174.1 thiamine phosphate synthase [Candidatus Manganitrophaceae bacterium]
MPQVDFTLYLITDQSQTCGRSLCEVIRQAGQGGIQTVQLREKDLPLRALLQLASEIISITREFGMKLLINDRVDVCLAIDADGVHLPSSGFPIDAARKILGMDKWIGVSCHSVDEVHQAEKEGADFAVLGPVYDTPSKRPYGSPFGLEAFREAKRRASIPLFAIGGVDAARLEEVFSAGADGVAMISGIVAAEDISERCRGLLNEINHLRNR